MDWFYMIGTSIMKEVTTLNSKFKKSEVKKENKIHRNTPMSETLF